MKFEKAISKEYQDIGLQADPSIEINQEGFKRDPSIVSNIFTTFLDPKSHNQELFKSFFDQSTYKDSSKKESIVDKPLTRLKDFNLMSLEAPKTNCSTYLPQRF